MIMIALTEEEKHLLLLALVRYERDIQPLAKNPLGGKSLEVKIASDRLKELRNLTDKVTAAKDDNKGEI